MPQSNYKSNPLDSNFCDFYKRGYASFCSFANSYVKDSELAGEIAQSDPLFSLQIDPGFSLQTDPPFSL